MIHEHSKVRGFISQGRKVGYVVKRYPRFSETFIVNELLAHEQVGLGLEVFSLRPPSDTHFQDAISRVRAPVTYLSVGRVKAEELWGALRNALGTFSDELPASVCAVVHELARESALDAYCGLQLAVAAKQRGITHLHAHFASSAATAARVASLVSGIPYSLTAHAKDIFHESVQDTDLRRKLADAQTTFTVSDYNQSYLQGRFGEAADRVVRLYNGIHLNQFTFESPVERARKIVAVGRLVEKKGFGDLLCACDILQRRGVQYRCEIVGAGELHDELLHQQHALALGDQVSFLGALPQPEVKRLLREAAVMAAPCVDGADGNRDGLPTVLLEAMALGTPCVSTDVTGIPEVLQNEVTGLLVSQRSPEELAVALERLLDAAELRVRLAMEARKLIEERFDIQANTQRQREYFLESVPDQLAVWQKSPKEIISPSVDTPPVVDVVPTRPQIGHGAEV